MRLLLASWMALFVVATAGPATADGLFGITADTRVDELSNCKPGRSEFYFDCEFPNASPFAKFEINIDPGKGPCGISATTAPVQSEPEARALLKTAFSFLDQQFTGLQERPVSELREIANGASGDWFEQARRYSRGPSALWVFSEPRADQLTLMMLSVSKPWAKPGVEIKLDGYYANRTICAPPQIPRKYK